MIKIHLIPIKKRFLCRKSTSIVRGAKVMHSFRFLNKDLRCVLCMQCLRMCASHQHLAQRIFLNVAFLQFPLRETQYFELPPSSVLNQQFIVKESEKKKKLPSVSASNNTVYCRLTLDLVVIVHRLNVISAIDE